MIALRNTGSGLTEIYQHALSAPREIATEPDNHRKNNAMQFID